MSDTGHTYVAKPNEGNTGYGQGNTTDGKGTVLSADDLAYISNLKNDNNSLSEKVSAQDEKIRELTDTISSKDAEITKLQRLLLEHMSVPSKSDEPKMETFSERYRKAIEENHRRWINE